MGAIGWQRAEDGEALCWVGDRLGPVFMYEHISSLFFCLNHGIYLLTLPVADDRVGYRGQLAHSVSFSLLLMIDRYTAS